MQILIILSSADPEIKWNAMRFGNFLLTDGEDVTLFLNRSAVDLYEDDSENQTSACGYREGQGS